jgi:predicted O-methyltransferase YrrM
MSKRKWNSVDQYINGLFAAHDAALEATLGASAAAGLPAINVTANQGKLLQILARSVGARKILEIGTLGGYSTIWLARALPSDGRLITLEYEPKHAEVARSNIARAGLTEKVEIRLGNALETLPGLEAAKAGPFDFIFIDADKPGYPDYLVWSLKLSRAGTLIVADNVIRHGDITKSTSRDPRVQGMRRFNELLAAESRVSATEIQTVGSKGYDGFAVALVIDGPSSQK